MKKTFKMKTVAEIASKALPPTRADKVGEKPKFSLLNNRSWDWIAASRYIGTNAIEERIYLGCGNAYGDWDIWVEERGEWIEGSGWGSFYLTHSLFNIANMPAIAYVGLFGESYDAEALMCELARRIADELEDQP
jgi:hypothetical protein